jgi:hypothetical protein
MEHISQALHGIQPKSGSKPLPFCRYIMPGGRRCRGIRLKDHPDTCYYHAPLAVRKGRGSSPLPFSRLSGMDREMLLKTSGQLTRKLATDPASSRRDRLLLYALQIMLQACKRDARLKRHPPQRAKPSV